MLKSLNGKKEVIINGKEKESEESKKSEKRKKRLRKTKSLVARNASS